jgi:hypothetical protein
MTDERRARMEASVAWCAAHISGDEMGEADRGHSDRVPTPSEIE